MQHDYEWAEIAGMALTILERDTEVRTTLLHLRHAPLHLYRAVHGQTTSCLTGHCEHRRGPCASSFTNINIRSRRRHWRQVSALRLTPTAQGSGSCGERVPHPRDGGGCRVVAINCPGQSRAERDAASEWFERYERGRLEEERRKRQERRSRKGGA